MNLPSSWSKMTPYARACYLMNTHQAKTWREAIAKARASVAPPVVRQKELYFGPRVLA